MLKFRVSCLYFIQIHQINKNESTKYEGPKGYTKKKKMGDNLFPTNFHYGVVSLAMELLINVNHIFPSYRKKIFLCLIQCNDVEIKEDVILSLIFLI